ncbi:hypothetical protein BD770DRAFT_388457 [Pilaira anomala]|nr:hypothetical protein BD770DRAFT_388457 [Pilaira anomala]
MADFICLAMASQYSESNNNNTDTTPASSPTTSFRRSLGTSTLFGRRSSRTTATPHGGTEEELAAADQHTPIHIRIVPSIENPSRSLVFSIIERDLEVGRVIKIGRFTDRSSVQNHISFKSKVVSRSHCEIWLNNDGKVQLKDTRSSSGTFVNHVRLSPANTESRPVEVRDGDLVQLGVDYQGGYEEIYRSVKMRFEVNRPQQIRPVSYSVSAFNNLRNLTNVLPVSDHQQQQQQLIQPASHTTNESNNKEIQVEECCICLYALAPFQALFVAPCSHSYHFKCIRPLFDSYPGFQCPICRTYSDLDASVAIETEEVIEKFGIGKLTCHKEQVVEEEEEQEEQEVIVSSSSSVPPTNVVLSSIIPPTPELPLSTTLVACTTSLSGILSSPTSSSHRVPTLQQQQQQQQNEEVVIVSRGYLNNNTTAGDHPQQQQRSSTSIEEDNNMIMMGLQQHSNRHNLVEKIKMAFSNEKRKGKSSNSQHLHHQHPGQSDTSSSSDEELESPLQPILSRQSTQYNALAEIIEEPGIGSHSGY